MAEVQMAPSDLGPQTDRTGSAEVARDNDLIQAVLDAYTSARQRYRFETALSAYRRRNPKAPVEDARHQVARIICGLA
jgi:hypothetical protein